jgi:hypothetical protein
MKNRSPFRILKFFLFGLLAIALLALFGWVVMSLWNWLTPALFGWKVVTYWQAVGLIVLSRLLFGGFGGSRGRGGHWGRRARERWEQMTPEEREKFRQGTRGCWNRVPPPDSTSIA